MKGYFFNVQGYGANCGDPIYSGVTSSVDKQTIVDVHNYLRRQVALGTELRGNPGPQPPAADMCHMVSITVNIRIN
jgi:hypothetical protein